MNSTVVPFDSDTSPALLERLGHLDVPERWKTVDRSAQSPHLVAVPGGDGGEWSAAALVTARPHTAYLKIVDAVGDAPAAAAAVVEHARRHGLAQVKWEGWTADHEAAATAGFVQLSPPLTQSATEDGPASGYVRWLHDGAVPEPPYYGQTTHFTCGAVTALIAQTHMGTLTRGDLDREAELTLWRDATNFPACEPVGLGVAVRRAWPTSPVTIHLDTDAPVLLDHLPAEEQEWRALLQRTSRTQAARIGVPVDARRLSITDIRATLDRRESVLLLVSLADMLGFDVPHWVLCHGTVPGAVVIEDPWANASNGDTWVDAHLLPVADASLDAMAAVSTERARGAVTIGRSPAPLSES
ncbi:MULTISPECIES: peptidase C39 family protein [unclassified Streptomyces]|uniref:peptidase C39 family protein n=1 Tax=unclassified Streptomyces TaxID=2593676 RepID=UPI000DB98DAB|nr:peptidase C39 family protein [Streptomyces sp. PsTaAH-137]MYT73548.1 acetyltransferase [Streptomyces sp. SID8367]RAJ85084.1 peptidase C3-like protein [Streptomyces sp. PsTaAH-137]